MSTLHRGQFTSRKVPHTTARILDSVVDDEADLAAVDRFSMSNAKEGGGIDGQVRLSRDLFYDHDDTRLYADLPTEWFSDPKADLDKLTECAADAGYRARWIRRCDLWPTEASDQPVAALICIGRTLFVRVESSGAKREIENFTGKDHNAYSLLLTHIAAHVDSIGRVRFSDDAHRFGRDSLGTALFVDECKQRGKTLQFGHRVANPQDPIDALITALLSHQGEQDNEARAIKMAGHYVSQLESGGCPLAESQLAHGVFHQRRTIRKGLVEQQEVIEKNGMKLPEFRREYVEVIGEVVPMLAQGDTYVDIGIKLAEFGVERRGQRPSSWPTFQSIIDDPALDESAKKSKLSESAKSFFIVSTHEDGSWVSDPDDPAFDEDMAELFTGKLTLWRTGFYPTKYEVNQLTGRGRAVKGRPLRYDDEDATTGWLPIRARWFVDDDGNSTTGVELPPDIWDAARRRLLTERRSRSETGGRAADQDRPRLFSFGDWYVEGDFDPYDPELDEQGNVVDHGVMQRHVQARQTHDRKNFVLRERPAAASTRQRADGSWSPRGWAGNEGEILATFNSLELARWLGWEARAALVDVLDRLEPIPMVSTRVSLPHGQQEGSELRAEHARLEKMLKTAELTWEGARTTLNLIRGRQADPDEELSAEELAEELGAAEQDVESARTEVRRLRSQLKKAQARLAELPEEPGSQEEVELIRDENLAEAAWWVASLLRTEDGTGTPVQAETTQRVTTGWQFEPHNGDLAVACTLEWPLEDGGVIRRHLQGLIDDVRGQSSRGAVAVYNLGWQGRSIEEQLGVNTRTDRRAHLVRKALDWLSASGRMPYECVRQAYVDHPIDLTRKVIYARLEDRELAVPNELSAWGEHLLDVYGSPDAPAGQGAACPDDITAVHRLMATFEQLPEPRVSLTAAARVVEVTTGELRRKFVSPQKRPGGHQRPPFLTVAEGGLLQPFRCPHDDCGSPWATVAVLLPEVWATGHGVLCSRCRRVPDLDYAGLVFPGDYVDRRYTRCTAADTRSLFKRRQTIAVEVQALDLPMAELGVTVAQLAKELDCSSTTIRATVHELGLTPRTRRGRFELTKPQADLIRQARSAA